MFVSQLNDTQGNGSKRITLDDLAGGKALARHCDWVLSLHRDFIYNVEANPTKAKLQVLKFRINSLKQFDIDFDPSTGICSW